MLWRCVWRIRGRWRLCASVTASCACVSLNVWEYTWPSNQRQQEQRQPRFTIISCTFFSSLSPSSLSHSIPHLFKQLITSGNFPDVLREKRLTSCRLKQLFKAWNNLSTGRFNTFPCLQSQEAQRNIKWCIATVLVKAEKREKHCRVHLIVLGPKKGSFSHYERAKFCFLSL